LFHSTLLGLFLWSDFI